VSAGLPGAGLAGLFFILSALLAVPNELVRTVRGRSSREAWLVVGRHARLALAMTWRWSSPLPPSARPLTWSPASAPSPALCHTYR
jgi:hypothetical protein